MLLYFIFYAADVRHFQYLILEKFLKNFASDLFVLVWSFGEDYLLLWIFNALTAKEETFSRLIGDT